MRTVIAFLFVLFANSADLYAVPNRPSKKDQVKTDKQRLQGNWVMVRWQKASAVVVYNPNERFYVWTIRGDRLTAKRGGLGWQLESTITIDPSKDPKALDAVDLRGPNKGKAGRYIYDLEGDTLSIGYGGDGQARPKSFTSQRAMSPIVIIFHKQKQ